MSSILRALCALAFVATFSRSVEAASITLAWDPNSETDIVGYILHYGTVPAVYTTTVDVGNVTTWTVSGLTAGQQYCFALRAYNTSGLQSPLSAEVCGMATSTAQLTTPPPGSTLPGASVQFQWLAGAGATDYRLSIGTTIGGVNLFDQDLGTNLSVSVTGLPTNGSTVYVRMWSLVSGGWHFTDYTYTAITCSYVLCPTSTLLTTQVPAGQNLTDGTMWELGMRFVSDVVGQITAVRFWKGSLENGPHVGRIWNAAGQVLATVTFSNETVSGWQQQALAAPLTIAANTEYVVTVTTGPNGYFVSSQAAFATPLANGHLQAPAGANGIFGSVEAFPTRTFNSSNYFRDIVFVAQ